MATATAPSLPLPPGPTRRFPGQHFLAVTRGRLEFFRRMVREYGDVVHVDLGPERLILVAHPELIKEVLVTQHRSFMKGRGLQAAKRLLGEGLLTSEGEFHLRQRRLAQPAFHRQRIARYAEVMGAYAARTGDRWRDGAEMDVAREMMALTLAIAGKTLFDADVEGEAAEIGEALTAALEMFEVAMLPFADLLDRLPLPWVKRFRRARERLDETMYRIIAEHRARGTDAGDLLSTLFLAQDAEGDGGGMTDLQLRDEAMTILLAGHETTANALAWTWYLLALHPDAEARLHAELDHALGDAPPGFDDLPRLPYARAVLAESMRLYPPAWTVGYRALEEVTLGDYRIPARSLVVMPQIIVHRHPRYWADPERFDPARWLEEPQPERPRFAYFPFGGGVRQCIGEHFAWAEGVIALATLARRWRLTLVPGHRVEPYPVFTLRPKFGIRVTAHSR